jgi:hypothetical protein
MRWVGLPRVFPLRSVLLLCSVPLMVFVIFAGWFRWQLSPLKGFYLMAYWESSTAADNPYNTTEFQWLNKTAPGRKSMPVIPHDVDSNGSGFLPIELSPSAREQGWVHLEKTPLETVGSIQLEGLLQSKLYDNLSLGQVLAAPLSYLCAIPIIVLYVAIWMKEGLVAEWRRLYEELHDDEFALNSSYFRSHFQNRIRPWIDRRIVSAKSSLLRFTSPSILEPHRVVSEDAIRGETGDVKLHLSAPLPAIPQRHSIFPGTSAVPEGNLQPKPWDESEWID